MDTERNARQHLRTVLENWVTEQARMLARMTDFRREIEAVYAELGGRLDCWVIGDEEQVLVSKGCMESSPCQHGICVDGVWKRMFAPEICSLMRERKLPVPEHFSRY